jgi:hypothetical protein
MVQTLVAAEVGQALPQHMNAWGMAVTVPALLLGGVLFCLGAPHLQRDQDAVLERMRSDRA